MACIQAGLVLGEGKSNNTHYVWLAKEYYTQSRIQDPEINSQICLEGRPSTLPFPDVFQKTAQETGEG